MVQTLSAEQAQLSQALEEVGLSFFDYKDGVLFLRLNRNLRKGDLDETDIDELVNTALAKGEAKRLYPKLTHYSVSTEEP